jgi:hypothetical protein
VHVLGSLGHLMSFSKNSMICFVSGNASKGCVN